MLGTKELREKNLHLLEKASKVKILFTDVDGVLTDGGVYYSAEGELMKRFFIRDGMGTERLRNLFGMETGIITGEFSSSVKTRAEELGITELYLGAKNKDKLFLEILEKKKWKPENVAYMGDDYNDLEIINLAGFTAAPCDAMPEVTSVVDYVCEERGGNGAFREFVELIIALKTGGLNPFEMK